MTRAVHILPDGSLPYRVNKALAVCEACGVDLAPGEGHVWRCRPTSPTCTVPSHRGPRRARGGWHCTCLDSDECRARAATAPWLRQACAAEFISAEDAAEVAVAEAVMTDHFSSLAPQRRPVPLSALLAGAPLPPPAEPWPSLPLPRDLFVGQYGPREPGRVMTLAQVIPGLGRCRPYQIAGAQALASGERVGLWYAPGTGKTATLLLALALAGVEGPVLFVTSALGRHVFARDAAWLLGPDRVPGVLWAGSQQSKEGVHEDGSYTSLRLALSERWGITTNYDVLGVRIDELASVPWRALVMDEAHNVKGAYKKARRRDGTVILQRYHHLRRLADGVRIRGGVVWEATATPIRDRRRDLWAQLDVVLPGTFGKSWDFLTYYCAGYINQWGGLDSSGESHTDDLQERLSHYFLRLTRADVSDALPSLQRDIRRVTPEAAKTKVDRKAARGGGDREAAIAYAAALKVQTALDLTLEYLASGLKVLVAHPRRELANSFMHELLQRVKKGGELHVDARKALRTLVVTGTSLDLRSRIKVLSDFNRAPGPACASVTADCMAESIDLQFVDAFIVTGLFDSPGKYDQFEGRFVRLQGSPTVGHYLWAEGTIDERIYDLVLSKVADTVNLQANTVGDTGVFKALRGELDEDRILAELRAWVEET